MLATRFARNAHSVRSVNPLSDDQIRQVAPSVFAENAHTSRSDRYTYIPTIDVLAGLRKEGFAPFMACQTRVRDSDARDYPPIPARARLVVRLAGPRELGCVPTPDSQAKQ